MLTACGTASAYFHSVQGNLTYFSSHKYSVTIVYCFAVFNASALHIKHAGNNYASAACRSSAVFNVNVFHSHRRGAVHPYVLLIVIQIKRYVSGRHFRCNFNLLGIITPKRYRVISALQREGLIPCFARVFRVSRKRNCSVRLHRIDRFGKRCIARVADFAHVAFGKCRCRKGEHEHR